MADKNRPLNINEQWKKEKDGLEILNELDHLAQIPFEEIDKSDIERLKWAGIYCQRPKNGRFLIRIKLASGALNAGQARVIAGISHDFGEDSIQITIRQCIQIHNILLRDIPEIFERLQQAGLTTVEGCGDVPRNILGNPLMGIDPEELFDTTSVVEAAVRRFVGNPEFSNLPRKYKLSFSANPHDAGYAAINDLAFTPAVGKDGSYGFQAWVGGGLSLEPHLARKLHFFIPQEKAVDVAAAVAEIFRDRGYRNNRGHCRLKYLVDDLGIEKMEELIEEITGTLPRGGRAYAKTWNRGNFYGIHPQKQEGLFYAGIAIPGGTMQASDLADIAGLAEKTGSGRMRTTNTHHLILTDIPEKNLPVLRQSALLEKFPLNPGKFSGYAASCTGNTYCSFAPIETKKRLEQMVRELDRRFPELKMPIRINLTGCPHSCAHPQIADIGFTGGRMKTDAGMTDAFTVMVGGHLGHTPCFGFKLSGRIPADQAVDLVTDMVRFYQEHRRRSERFYDFVQRTGSRPFQKILDGYVR